MASIMLKARAKILQEQLREINMFHSAGDGKGSRTVYVNGNRIDHVVWANEEQGLVCFHPSLKRGRLSNKERRKGEIHTQILRGNVTVEFVNE